MYCPFCDNTDTKVLESRTIENSIRRRRECINCNNRFTTYEKAFFNFNVIKKEGKEEKYDYSKIYDSVKKACSKTEPEQIEDLSRKIERKILNKKNHPIKTTEIGKIVMIELKKFDKIAYFRFASVYKSIQDLELLKKEINQVK